MATPGLSEIVTTTLQNRTRKLADNMSRNTVLLNRMQKRGTIRTFSGGRTIVQELNYANNSTYTRYSGYQALNVAPADVFTAAEFPIRQAAVAVSISGLEELQNAGQEQMIDLIESRVSNAEQSMMNGIDYDLHSDGSYAGQIGGLQALVSSSPTSGTIGGIDRATWQFWRNVAASAVSTYGAAATTANIQSYMNRVALSLVRGNDATDLILADNSYYRLYLESLQAIQRITDPDMGAAGFTALMYYGAGKGCPVVLDGGFQGFSGDGLNANGVAVGAGGAPTSTMYFLNTKYLHYRPHSARNMTVLDPGNRFSVNQDAMVRLIGWAGNMTMSNAFLQGVLVA